jgi:hypothetical protein
MYKNQQMVKLDLVKRIHVRIPGKMVEKIESSKKPPDLKDGFHINLKIFLEYRNYDRSSKSV